MKSRTSSSQRACRWGQGAQGPRRTVIWLPVSFVVTRLGRGETDGPAGTMVEWRACRPLRDRVAKQYHVLTLIRSDPAVDAIDEVNRNRHMLAAGVEKGPEEGPCCSRYSRVQVFVVKMDLPQADRFFPARAAFTPDGRVVCSRTPAAINSRWVAIVRAHLRSTLFRCRRKGCVSSTDPQSSTRSNSLRKRASKPLVGVGHVLQRVSMDHDDGRIHSPLMRIA